MRCTFPCTNQEQCRYAEHRPFCLRRKSMIGTREHEQPTWKFPQVFHAAPQKHRGFEADRNSDPVEILNRNSSPSGTSPQPDHERPTPQSAPNCSRTRRSRDHLGNSPQVGNLDQHSRRGNVTRTPGRAMDLFLRAEILRITEVVVRQSLSTPLVFLRFDYCGWRHCLHASQNCMVSQFFVPSKERELQGISDTPGLPEKRSSTPQTAVTEHPKPHRLTSLQRLRSAIAVVRTMTFRVPCGHSACQEDVYQAC